MIKRIKSLISVKNLTASQFADLLGVQRSNISHILSGRNKPSLDFILKISEHFPAVSLEWLINGKGEMFNIEDKNVHNVPSQLNIEIESSTLDKERNIEFDKDSESFVRKELESNDLENPTNILSKDIKEPIVSSASTKAEIEQIMVLFNDDSFRVYNPQK